MQISSQNRERQKYTVVERTTHKTTIGEDNTKPMTQKMNKVTSKGRTCFHKIGLHSDYRITKKFKEI